VQQQTRGTQRRTLLKSEWTSSPNWTEVLPYIACAIIDDTQPEGMEDDDGFVGYLPTTVDPGYALLIATTLFCLATNLMMPCAVSLGRRYEKRRLARRILEQQDGPAGEENRSEQPAPPVQDLSKQVASNEAKTSIHDDTASSVGPNSYVHGKTASYPASPKSPRTPTGMVQGLLDKVRR
jgi:hypothetical protein